MQNKFNNTDLEQFVKQNADQYRMFPSDKVWKGIHNTLHTRRRWYGIGLALLLLTTGVVTWVMLLPEAKNREVISALPKTTTPQAITEKKQNKEVVIVPAKAVNNKTPFVSSTGNLQKAIFINDITTSPESVIDPAGDPGEASAIVYNDPAPVTRVESTHQPETIIKNTVPVKQIVHNKPVHTPVLSAKVNDYSFSAINKANNKKETSVPAAEEKIMEKRDIYPYTIESVVNSYNYREKGKKASLLVYFTPTVSYRALKENKVFITTARNATSGTNNTFSAADVNSVVTHKPDIGFQLGIAAGYPLSKNLSLIGGLQFNVSKYDIRAYAYPSEVATIALNSSGGGGSSVSNFTNYRNTGGYKANWLHNFYFSASAPIGLDLKLVGNRKTYFGVSGTVQPTYILGNRAYLLSTDYKNYLEVPSLTRKWNISTGFELYAGYTTGNLKWRVGPQVRYQALSSFKKSYPVEEHLFDFGLKLGLMLNK